MTNILPGKLAHIGAKVFRSIEHCKALDKEITDFFALKPYEIITEFDAKERTHSYRVKALQEVPLSIRVLTGEVLCQLRSALDHLTWQLALLNSNKPPGDSTQFPIFIDRAKYTGKIQSKYIGSLDPQAQQIINGLQPYLDPTPEDNLLGQLHRLANDDKHRLPHVAFCAPAGVWLGDLPEGLPKDGMGVGFSNEARRGRDLGIEMRIGPFDNEQIIGKVAFKNAAETDLEVERVTISIQLAFGADSAAKGRLILPTLKSLGMRVEEVVRMFTHFF